MIGSLTWNKVVLMSNLSTIFTGLKPDYSGFSGLVRVLFEEGILLPKLLRIIYPLNHDSVIQFIDFT